MMMMTMMTNTIPYRRTKTHVWDKVLMGIWVHPISAAYELIINIADLFNFSEGDIFKKELAKQWRLKKALCSLVVPFPHSPSFSGRFHEVEFSSTFPLSNKIYSRVSHLQFFGIFILFQAGICARHTKEQEKYRSYMFYISIFQRFLIFVIYNYTLQLQGENGQNKPENPQNWNMAKIAPKSDKFTK